MFENVPPPKPRVPGAVGPKAPEHRKPRAISQASKVRNAIKRAKKLADKELKVQVKKLQHLKEKVNKKKESLKEAQAVVDNQKGLVEIPIILEAPRTVQNELLDRPIAFEANPGPQTEFLAASEREVFYGGARGGGKSYSLLVDPLRYCDKEVARALIIRRTMPELRDLINHSQRLYKKAYPKATFREQEKEWRFPSGARIEFGYAENRQDALRYQGQSYTWIGVDELPQFPTADIWNDLRGSLRSVDPTIPEFMRATGNPGNVGSNWVKETFIDPAPYNTRFEIPVELPNGTQSKITRRFIPAKLADNPYLAKGNYMTMLASLPETQRRQWLEGDWDAWDGAAFPEFKREIHVCEPFDLPKTWVRFRACDWGYSSPAVCLWFAIDYDNNLWVYREFKITNMTADRFAAKIREFEHHEKIQYGVLDSSVWSKRGDVGPSIVEVMRKEGITWRPSDRSPGSRKSGKMEVHRRLAINEFTKLPTIKIFSTCHNLINELPALPLDDDDPEDVDSKANDHAYDALRYGCMSRALSPTKLDFISKTIEQNKYQPADPIFGY